MWGGSFSVLRLPEASAGRSLREAQTMRTCSPAQQEQVCTAGEARQEEPTSTNAWYPQTAARPSLQDVQRKGSEGLMSRVPV